MCGVVGMFATDHAPGEIDTIIRAASDTLTHRGPDDQGVWVDAEAGVALGHRRLSVIDLSVHGHQPMLSPGGRYVIAYNGEIYNFQQLRTQLDVAWSGHSDTEVLLAAIEQWGVAQTLPKLNGMFAFALWDRHEGTLTLARDRIGEKPLYYAPCHSGWIFASELKALRAIPPFQPTIDRNALALYLRYNYIPTPHSIYQDCHKLQPGCYVQLRAGQDPVTEAYWSLGGEVARANGWDGTDEDAVNQLEALLDDAINLRRIADVPLGAFLSGGIDSSTIVARMQAQSDRPINSFTIGFESADYNEAEDAKRVAQHLGTHHTELYVSPAQARDVIPRLPQIYDEPFADASQIPTFLVAELARQQVTVALSGDGADELFGGYNRHVLAPGLWRKLARIPLPLRNLAASALLALPPAAYGVLHTPLAWCGSQHKNVGEKVHKLAGVMGAASQEALYEQLVSQWQRPSNIVIGSTEPPATRTNQATSFEAWMMYLDTTTYLPDDILVKVDRAAMAVSLETRIPFLDPQIIAFANQLPLHLKLRDGKGKWLVRQLLARHLPTELIDRPKTGFAVPIDHWLRHELRDWAEDLLGEERLRREGYFDPEPIRACWQQHLSGKRNWQYHLWSILMFQAWLEQQA